MLSNVNDKSVNKCILILAFSVVFLFVFICFVVFGGGDVNRSQATFADDIGKGRISILATGKDTVSGLMDVLLLVNVNLENGNVNVVQIPRDTFLSSSNGTKCKINSAAHTLGGIDQLVALLESAFNIDIDHTVEFTLDTFSRFIDLIGGVEVNVPCDMDYDDPQQGLSIHLKTGKQLLYGREAVQFVRYRAGYIQGDIARIDAQKIFIAALADKIKNGLSPYKIPAIVGALIGDVNTDMSLRQCMNFANFALNVDMSNITLTTLPGEATRTKINSGAWYYVIYKRAAFDVIKKYFNFDNASYENFDPHRIFSSSSFAHFDKIYYSEKYSIIEYTADDIIKNGIDIDLTPK